MYGCPYVMFVSCLVQNALHGKFAVFFIILICIGLVGYYGAMYIDYADKCRSTYIIGELLENAIICKSFNAHLNKLYKPLEHHYLPTLPRNGISLQLALWKMSNRKYSYGSIPLFSMSIGRRFVLAVVARLMIVFMRYI